VHGFSCGALFPSPIEKGASLTKNLSTHALDDRIFSPRSCRLEELENWVFLWSVDCPLVLISQNRENMPIRRSPPGLRWDSRVVIRPPSRFSRVVVGLAFLLCRPAPKTVYPSLNLSPALYPKKALARPPHRTIFRGELSSGVLRLKEMI